MSQPKLAYSLYSHRLSLRPQADLWLTSHMQPGLLFNGLYPHNPCNCMDYLLLIYRPQRDGRLSWPGWMTHSGHLTHEVVTCQPQIRHRSEKVSQSKTDVLTTEPRERGVLVIHYQNPQTESDTDSQFTSRWSWRRLSIQACRQQWVAT